MGVWQWYGKGRNGRIMCKLWTQHFEIKLNSTGTAMWVCGWAVIEGREHWSEKLWFSDRIHVSLWCTLYYQLNQVFGKVQSSLPRHVNHSRLPASKLIIFDSRDINPEPKVNLTLVAVHYQTTTTQFISTKKIDSTSSLSFLCLAFVPPSPLAYQVSS